MEPEKQTKPTDEPNKPADTSQAPADALSKTPEELEEAAVDEAAANINPDAGIDTPVKKVSPIKRFFKKINLYLLIFILLVAVAGAVTVVQYLNSQKPAPTPTIATQGLTQDTLKQLANTDATVGNTSQTLTIQGNAVIAGQSLMRGNLNVAGNLQTGGSITGPSLTISGTSNLGQSQMNSLQVAQNAAIQGSTTMRDLSVAGTTSLNGAVTASQLTVSRLILSGNASLQIPNHISFTGPSPNRNSINNAVLGNGGSANIGGSDTTGTITINTGNNPVAGCFARINFAQSFSNQPHVIVSPVGAGAGQTQYYVDRNQSGFSICTANAAPANQSFAYDYFVTN